MLIPFPSITHSIVGAIGAMAFFTSQLFSPFNPVTFETANDIPSEMFQDHSIIHGKVERVIDGDTIRIRHLPLYPLQIQNEFNGKLSDHTITIRFYGIDAPETAKNGNPSMPFANEAKDYTMSKIDGDIVNVKILRKDQYSRVVGKVYTHECYPMSSFTDTTTTTTVSQNNNGNKCQANYDYLDLSLGLAHNGFSTLYDGKGAEYDGNKIAFEREINFAQMNRKGVWVNGIDNVQTPAEYKRAMKEKQNVNK